MRQPPVWGLPGARARSRRAGVAALAFAAVFAAGCKWGDGPGNGSPVRSVVISVEDSQILVGASTLASAKLFDIDGNEVPDLTPVWVSITPAVVSVSAGGEITGLQAGTGLVRALSGSVSSEATVIVRNPAPISIALARDTATLFLPGGTVQTIATVTDETGHSVVNPAIVWTSSHPLIATVNVAGLVSAVASGDAVITGAIGGLTASMQVMVRPASATGAPIVTAVAPAILRPGIVATISGTNFGATVGANQVFVDGVPATVQTASTTQLVITMPVAGFGCEPSRDAFVQVGAGGLVGARAAPLQSANRRALAVGQSAIISDLAEVRCNELVPGSGRWVVSVYNASRSAVSPGATGNVQFQIRGVGGAALASTSAALRASGPGASIERDEPARVAPASPHLSLLDENIRALRAAGRHATHAAVPLSPGAVPAKQIATVGSITGVRIPNLDGSDFCVQNFPVNARTVYSSAHALILEDTTGTFNGKATLRGLMDNYFTRLGNEFETVMWPILSASFGNPLAMDAQLSNIGKVVMVFSPRVNAMKSGTVTGFVANCDFFPVGQRPSSNGGAFFYAAVPTNTAVGYSQPDTRDQWLRLVRSTAIHEVKHLVAFAERLSRGAALEDLSWEEGSARVAEEIFARSVYGTAPLTNLAYAPSIGCDIKYELVAPPCADRPLLMLRHFDALYRYMEGPEIYSPLGRAVATDVNFYAGAWSFLRWASEHFGTEQQFFRDHTAATTTGVSNVEARTGRPWEESLGEWSIAAYVDEIGGFTPENTRLTMRSWNYPDIWLGLCRDLGPCASANNPVQLYTRSTPFAPRERSFGNFQVGVGTMIGGGFTLLDLDGPGFASQVIEVKALSGSGDAPSTVRIAIARVR